MRNLPSLPSLAFLTALAAHAIAAPLKEAKINQIVNDVKVVEPREGAHPAVLQQVIKNDLGVATGVQSRAELLFQDDTLTRLGAETFFSFAPGTRDLRLDRGSMLLQVPKNHGGATIRAASVTASITGTTVMIENLPGNCVKLVVLEGSMRVGMNGNPSGSVMLEAGKMLIVPRESKEMPKPLEVNLRKLVHTSALIDPGLFQGKSKTPVPVLPSLALIEKVIAQQDAHAREHALAVVNIETTTGTADGTSDVSTLPVAGVLAASTTPTASTPLTVSTPLSVASSIPGQPGTQATLQAVATALNPLAIAPLATIAPALPTTTTPPGTGTTIPPGTGTTLPGTGTGTASPAFITAPSPYVASNKTTINTATRTITTLASTNPGALYQSTAINGRASTYLFNTPTAFDTATNFDATFSVKNGAAAPTGGTAVYRFTGLLLDGNPAFNVTGGASDVALVAQNGILSTSSGSAWALDSLRSLFFGSLNSPIVLSGTFQKFPLFSRFAYMQVYARGASGVATLDGTFNLPFSNLYATGEAGVHSTSNSSINALNVVFDSPATITLDGRISATSVRLNSGSGIRVNNAPGTFSLDATAPLFSSSTNIGVTSGFLNIGAGGLNTAGRSLTGFDHITVAGSAVVGSIQVRNALAIGGTLTASAANGAVNLDAGSIAVAGGVNLNGAASRPGGSLTVNATNVAVGATGINGITANGSDGLLALAPGGNGGTVNIGTAIKPVTNAINVTAPISATTGANATGLLTGGNGGTVKLTANGAINVNSSIKVSDSAALRASKNGGVISIASRKTSGTAITVNNSGQLLALLNSASTGRGGTVTFASSGGDIVVNGGTVTADRGTVDVRNYGAGAVNLANANIRGDIVKVGALGANGQLIIGGGNISADTTLKLYGGTSNGQVRFTDNVTLGGAGAKIIAGKTVTINPTKVVTIGGASKAKVYTTTPNYTGSGGNGSSSGSFGGAGASTLGYSGRPIF